MSIPDLVGSRVGIFVSDPWEFGTECGVGPFPATVTAAEPTALLLHLDTPIRYRGAELLSVLIRPRHAPGTIERLVSEGGLAANLTFLRVEVGALSGVTEESQAGMVPAIGSVIQKSG